LQNLLKSTRRRHLRGDPPAGAEGPLQRMARTGKVRSKVKAPDDVESWLQRQLRTMAVDDGSCAYFISGNIATIENYTLERWQFGLDMIYRCLKSGLILVHDFVGYPDEVAFIRALQTLSPFEDEGGVLWNGSLIYGSDFLVEVVEKHFPPSAPYSPASNSAFGEELDSIFQRHGVPWSETPLLPILSK